MAKKKKSNGLTIILISLASLLVVGSVSAISKINDSSCSNLEDKIKEILPVAKYEFNDESNPGKDSMGKYDLVKTGNGSIKINDGVADFDGYAGLVSSSNDNDISENLKSFTLFFEFKSNLTPSNGWASPVSFGWNDWSATKWCTFNYGMASSSLRFSTASELIDGFGNVNKDCYDKSTNTAFYGPELGIINDNEYHKVCLVVNLDNFIDVYFDDELKLSYQTPVNYSLSDPNMRFSIGGESCWGNIYNTFNGTVTNVEIYNIPFTDKMIEAYSLNGFVTNKDF